MRDRHVAHDPAWHEALVLPGCRLDDTPDVYSVTEFPWPSAEDLQVIWVRSLVKVTPTKIIARSEFPPARQA